MSLNGILGKPFGNPTVGKPSGPRPVPIPLPTRAMPTRFACVLALRMCSPGSRCKLPMAWHGMVWGGQLFGMCFEVSATAMAWRGHDLSLWNAKRVQTKERCQHTRLIFVLHWGLGVPKQKTGGATHFVFVIPFVSHS